MRRNVTNKIFYDLIGLTFVFAVSAICPAQSSDSSEEHLRTLVSRLSYLNVSDALFDRFQGYGKPEYSAPNGKVFEELLSPRHTTASLRALLANSDPKVRTLAMVALYSKEEPSILPDIVSLAHDTAQTFPEQVPIARTVSSPSEIPLHEKTVGEVAQNIVRIYMEAAGYYYGIDGARSEPGFAAYWNQRKNRKYCASWFAIKLRRASTGCAPTDQSRRDKILSVRKQLDLLPRTDRDWTLLWLQTENGFDVLGTEQDLAASMKEIGPDQLLKMLQSNMPADDPDLKPRKMNNYPYQFMQLSVLKRASKVLRPDQSGALLAIDSWERDHQKYNRQDPLISPWWSIAAAELNKSQSSTILHDAFVHLDQDFYGNQKADLAAALFRLRGMSEKDFLLNCFYSPSSLVINKQYSQFRPSWLAALGSSGERSVPLLKAIIKDKRFDELNDLQALSSLSQTLAELTRKTNQVLELQRSAWHPLGVERACTDIVEAAKQYPKETEQLLETLKQMRATIKTSIN